MIVDYGHPLATDDDIHRHSRCLVVLMSIMQNLLNEAKVTHEQPL